MVATRTIKPNCHSVPKSNHRKISEITEEFIQLSLLHSRLYYNLLSLSLRQPSCHNNHAKYPIHPSTTTCIWVHTPLVLVTLLHFFLDKWGSWNIWWKIYNRKQALFWRGVFFVFLLCLHLFFFQKLCITSVEISVKIIFFFLPPFIYFVCVTKPLQRTERNYNQPVSKTMVAIPWRPWNLAWQLYEQFEDLEAT